MASTQLTDEEIFSELKRLGFTPGPVTENTRPVYLKKLKKLREEQQQRGSRAGKSRSSGASFGGAAGGGAAAFRPGSPDVTHLDSGRRAGQKSTVLGFSSDESDAEIPPKRKDLDHNSRAYRSSGSQQQVKISPATAHGVPVQSSGGAGTSLSRGSLAPDGQKRVSLGWGVSAASGPEAGGRYYDESADEDDNEREPEMDSRSLNGRASSRLKSSKLMGDYSDTDEESVEPGSEERLRSDRRGASLHGLSRERRAEANPPGGRDVLASRGEEEEGKKYGVPRCHRFPTKSVYLSLDDHFGGKAARNNHVDGASRSPGRSSSGLRSRFCNHSSLSQTYRSNHSNHTPNHSHGPDPLKRKLAAPEDELLQQFKREEAASSGSFSAHYLSMVLLSAACLFFLLLGLVYLRMRGSVAPEAGGVIKSHPFGEAFDSSYDKAEKDLILTLLLSLHDHLAFIAGQHDCGDQQHPDRSLSIQEASAYLQTQNKKFENLTLTSLEWIIRTGQDVGIRLCGSQPEDPVTDVSEIYRLESTHPKMSFTCRFRRAFLTVMGRVVLMAAVVGCVWGVFRYMKYRWRREEEDTRKMYDMVEKIIDVLRSRSDSYQDNLDQLPYLPIPHVRDSLVPPQDRKKMKKIWERAERFVSANESRVRTESQTIGGAEFMVWRWIQPSLSSEKISSLPSKVWQGKAFPLDRRNSPPNSLTPCLKIRNMFDPVMEVGDHWDLAIHQAILEKCSDNAGIVHIAVDKNSREGCVYVKCLSAEHSGKAFKALHGSWFDGKLVTVKYLHLDRYHQRFPQAQGCCTPLKASALHEDPACTSTSTSTSNSGSPGFS